MDRGGFLHSHDMERKFLFNPEPLVNCIFVFLTRPSHRSHSPSSACEWLALRSIDIFIVFWGKAKKDCCVKKGSLNSDGLEQESGTTEWEQQSWGLYFEKKGLLQLPLILVMRARLLE